MAAIALALAGCGQGGGSKVDGPVTVYVSLPLSGPRAADGRDAADGARLALERAGGKAGGIEVRAEVLDDAEPLTREGPPAAVRQWDPAATAANARAAAQDSSTAAYIGELDSEPTRTSLPITNDAGIAQISPGAGGIDLTQPAAGYPDSPERYRPSGETSFARVVPDDGREAAAAADLAIELGFTRVRVIAHDTPFDQLIASEFRRAAAQVGVDVAEQDPDAVLEIGQASGLRLIPGADADVAPGAETHGVEEALAVENLTDQGFAGEFEGRYGRAPGPYAAYGYEAMSVALDGIAAAADGDEKFRTAVVDTVLGSEHADSLLGEYSIDDDGDTTLCALQPYTVTGPDPLPGKPICPTG